MAISQTLLISQADLQTFASASVFVEPKYVEPYILQVQYLYVKPVLCTEFYTELLLQTLTNTLTYENKELLTGKEDGSFLGLQMWLLWLAYAEYLIFCNTKDTQSGIRIWQDQTSEVPTDKKMEMLIQKAKDNANLYKEAVLVYLSENLADFPTYKDSNCNNCQGNERNKGNTNISAISKNKY